MSECVCRVWRGFSPLTALQNRMKNQYSSQVPGLFSVLYYKKSLKNKKKKRTSKKKERNTREKIGGQEKEILVSYGPLVRDIIFLRSFVSAIQYQKRW